MDKQALKLYLGSGPFTPGFRIIPFDDVQSLETAITPNTVAFLVEPIQGEAGVIIPHAGYLKAAKALCEKHRVIQKLAVPASTA